MNQNRYTAFGSAFRVLREKKGLSQEAVAKAAGIGRSTLVHLENGADVRLSKISAVAKALDASIETTAEPKELTERRQARLHLSLRLLALQKAHLRIALDLLLEDPATVAALHEARAMVELWAREKVCSAFYIDSWQQLLTGSAHEVGTALARIDKQWESALLQNSPFGARLSQIA
jgi:transcriptional regulator with XRE-family HTH domain